MLNAVSLLRSIFGPTRGSILPLAYAIDITAERIFIDRISEEELKLCEDVCFEVSRRLRSPLSPKSALRAVERWANRCWDEIEASGQVEKYLGKQIGHVESPRKMVIYLATYMYFEKPYFQMIVETPEMFTGQKIMGLALQ